MLPRLVISFYTGRHPDILILDAIPYFALRAEIRKDLCIFFLDLYHVGGSNPAGPNQISFLTLRGILHGDPTLRGVLHGAHTLRGPILTPFPIPAGKIELYQRNQYEIST